MDVKNTKDCTLPELCGELRNLADRIENRAIEMCGECMGATFGDCEECNKREEKVAL